MMKKNTFPYLLVILFIGLVALRVVHISADPPAELSWSGGLFFDEGALAHNARNKVLFGAWKFDEWNDFYYSPILTYIKWLVFRIFGVGIAQLRLVPIIFSGLTLLALYQTLKLSLPRSTAVLSVFLLGVNYLYVMYSRIGLTETPLLLFTMLTVYFWQAGLQTQRSSRARWLMFWGGVNCFTVYIFKALAVYFLPVPFAALFLLILFADTNTRRKELLFLSGSFFLGLLVTAGIWYGLFYMPNYDAIHQAGEYVKNLSFPTSFPRFWQNVRYSPFIPIFLQTPVVFVMSWLYLMYLFALLWIDRSRITTLDLFMALWFLAHLAFFLGYAYRPTRYYIPIIPPMAVLAARGIMRLWRVSELRIPSIKHAVGWFWAAGWLLGIALWLYVFVYSLYTYGFLPFVTIPPPSFWLNLLAGIVFSGAAAIGLFWSIPKHRGKIAAFPRWIFQGIALGLIAAALNVNAWQYYEWVKSPHYIIQKTSQELGALLPEGSLIAGLATPMLCMENRHHPLYVWDKFVNYRKTFQKYPVTHLFLAEFNDELRYYYRRFRRVMKRATLLRTYWIKDSPFHLFSLQEPTFEAITPSQTQLQAGEPFSVTLEVRNNHPQQARELEVGWLLRPQQNSSAPLPMKTVELELAPLEQKAVTLSASVPAGTYRLLAGFFSPEQRVYEAETLLSNLAQINEDVEAINGMARRVPQSREGYLVYGPYHKYPPGKYEVGFRMKYVSGQECPPGQAIAEIDVTRNMSETIVASRKLWERDFQQNNGYHTFALPFFLESSPKLEFRAFASECAEVWIDRITVTFLRGTWYPGELRIEN